MTLRMGSLFAGYEGLGIGVGQVLDVDLAWVSEIEAAPSAILAHHYPNVPNHGDITTIDWSAVEPVDVLTGGFPCQDVSAAGKRAGLKPGTRTGLWSHMAYAIDQLRPLLVVAENVRGLLSAEAHSEVDPCPWCVGDGPATGLRALGAVLGDLADLGYDARWCGLRAADVGAPHGRFRVFVVAWPAADAGGERRVGGAGVQRARRDAAERIEAGDHVGDAGGAHLAEDTDGPTGGEWGLTAPGQEEGGRARADTRGRDRAPVADDAAADADSDGLESFRGIGSVGRDVDRRDGAGEEVAWGPYEPAIRRWEAVLGRVAPPPTEPGRNGAPRLSPRFVEWMMGLPAGWVTDVPGLSRNDQLKALGNGVVPQQATEALRWLLASDEARRAAA